MPDFAPGSIIGHYRLLRQLGAGGMGEVYLAERQSDFNKRVALKLIRPEMVNAEVIRRFAIERQTLAALHHPHIVGLLDGGTTDQGMPYLVVDYVEGVAIDRYCSERRLAIPERLRLFLQVCAAVHHAHQSLVIHCDLKPANILVTPTGEPMLLDFGIAKLLDPAAVGVTVKISGETRAGFTPQYASPEQMLGLPVTTATDVYALGVVLYELLTGRCPHQMAGSMAEWIRSICERDAEAPSSAVRRLSGQPPPGTAPAPDPWAAERMLRGDLDAIVLKALRKEPRDRYPSVDQMAEDVRRHLDGRLVLAHRNTTQYVVRKFVARHKLGVAAAAAALVLAAAGLAAILYEARLAGRRFEDVRSLAHTFLFDVHDAIQDLPGSTPARSMIANTGTAYLDRLTRDARGDRSLQLDVAEGYLKIGDVQGNPYEANLGDTAKALDSYRKALALAAAGGLKDAKSKQIGARIHENLAAVLAFVSKSGEALEHGRQAIVLYKDVAASDSRPEAKLDLARGYETLGDLLGGARGINAAKFEEAQASYEQSLALIPQLASGHPAAPRAMRAKAVILMKLGDAQARTMRLAGAMTQYRAALEYAEKLQAADPNNVRSRNLVTVALNKIASTHMSLEQNEAAEATYLRVISINEGILAADPSNERARGGAASAQKNLGDLYYYNLHRFPDALRCFRRAVELLELQVKADPGNIVWKQNLSESLTYVASALMELKRPAEARPEAQRGLEIARQIADRPGASHDQIYNYAWLGITIEPQDLRDGRTVLPYARRAVEMSREKDPFDLHVLGEAYAALGDFARAEEAESKALALFPPLEPGQPVPGPRQTVETSLAEYRKKLGQGGQNRGVALANRYRTSPLPAPQPAFGLEDWLATPGWTREGPMLRRKGGDFVLAPPDFASGSVEFTAMLLKGKTLAWVAAYRDLKNYCLFELESENLAVYRIVDGKRTRIFSGAHKLPENAAARIRVQASEPGIMLSVFRDGAWQAMGAGSRIEAQRGKFGFRVNGSDEIGVTEFKLTIQHE
jgi:tetratricopeptide (TPR) repeat protein